VASAEIEHAHKQGFLLPSLHDSTQLIDRRYVRCAEILLFVKRPLLNFDGELAMGLVFQLWESNTQNRSERGRDELSILSSPFKACLANKNRLRLNLEV
jgi:hypothetical protein